MICGRFHKKFPFTLVRQGHECAFGAVVGVKNKCWLLDKESCNFLISGGDDFCRSLTLLTIEYLSNTSPHILLFQNSKENEALKLNLQNHGYYILPVYADCQHCEREILKLLLVTTPTSIFVDFKCIDCVIAQLLSLLISKYDECAAPIPVFVFVPITTAIRTKGLMSRARGRNIMFIANGRQLSLDNTLYEMFDVMVSETDLRTTKNAITCKRGFSPIECSTSFLI